MTTIRAAAADKQRPFQGTGNAISDRWHLAIGHEGFSSCAGVGSEAPSVSLRARFGASRGPAETATDDGCPIPTAAALTIS